jgi:hypothetical protein
MDLDLHTTGATPTNASSGAPLRQDPTRLAGGVVTVAA